MADNRCADDFPGGSVWLVGAGPGDPELLTLKAARLIATADVLFYDALVGAQVLALAKHAERIPVGKRSGRHSKDQSTIDALLVAAARSGKRVLRLKGGDPAVFARSAEELTALRQSGIPVRICPGITTASAAAASACISLSLRGVAREVRFVTAHSRSGVALDLDWPGLAAGEATLAFYMGRCAAGEIARRLIAAGLDGATPVLIACNVSLPGERRLTTRLDLLGVATRAFAQDMPTLILVGEALRNGSETRRTCPSVYEGADGQP